MSDSDDHYYLAGYSVEDDPYVQENGVLINRFRFTTTEDLNEFEKISSALAIEQMVTTRPAPVIFDVETFKGIHREIFEEVYPWAGEFRKVDLGKGDTRFVRHTEIESRLMVVFEALEKVSFLKGLEQNEFVKHAAAFLVEVNAIHPFREGNGRAQRTILSLMAGEAGYTIAWEGISNHAMRNACIAGIEGDQGVMAKLLKIYLSSRP